jgi:hypothetical protein
MARRHHGLDTGVAEVLPGDVRTAKERKGLGSGDNTCFPVITSSISIGTLKDVIKEKGKNGVLNRVDVNDLTLWKVRMTLASDSTTNSPAG